jgi:hypothetical protein
MKDLYDTIKKLAGNFRQTSQQIKDKHGKVLTTTEEQLTRWEEHFKGCLGLLSEPLVEYYLDLNLWLFSTS